MGVVGEGITDGADLSAGIKLLLEHTQRPGFEVTRIVAGSSCCQKYLSESRSDLLTL